MGPAETRFIGAIVGYGRLATSVQPLHWGRPFRCRTQSLSTRAVVIAGSTPAHTGQHVQLRLEVVGTLMGRVSHRLANGLAIRLELDIAERDLLQRRIDWLKKKLCLGIGEQRAARRVAPRDRRSVIILGDGAVHACSIIDQSTSGVAVSAAIIPPVGTPLAVGRLIGRVARYLDGGFAVQFLQACAFADLESALRPPA